VFCHFKSVHVVPSGSWRAVVPISKSILAAAEGCNPTALLPLRLIVFVDWLIAADVAGRFPFNLLDDATGSGSEGEGFRVCLDVSFVLIEDVGRLASVNRWDG
jgi:hypothetical protein